MKICTFTRLFFIFIYLKEIKYINASWKMSQVTSIQARISGIKPIWDRTYKKYILPFGETFEERYRSGMDTINTASIEGALMYIQTEGINIEIMPENFECLRKNDMSYILFYEIHIVQPNSGLAKYGNDPGSALEYCPHAAMDLGKCSPESIKDNIEIYPEICNYYHGSNNENIIIGPCIGSTLKDTDKRAPYYNNYWFSYPNSCLFEKWNEFNGKKTDSCRNNIKGGLCPYGTEPNGIDCTYSYKIIGYLSIDELVGITDMTSTITNKKYTNYKEFCLDKNNEYNGIEFQMIDKGNNKYEYIQSIPFWENPLDVDKNMERMIHMINIYQKNIKNQKINPEKNEKMEYLPTIEDLTKKNPPCYKNVKTCDNGCKRSFYSQICLPCDPKNDKFCITKPNNIKSAPELKVILKTPEKQKLNNNNNNNNPAPLTELKNDDISTSSGTLNNNPSLIIYIIIFTVLSIFY